MIIIELPPVNSRCCNEIDSMFEDVSKTCTDGGLFSSLCCGCGGCNIFCCNCGNGCNSKWTKYWNGKGYHYPYTCGHKKREIDGNTLRNDSLDAELIFGTIDINRNNVISKKEADVYLKYNSKFKRSLGFSLDNELKKWIRTMTE